MKANRVLPVLSIIVFSIVLTYIGIQFFNSNYVIPKTTSFKEITVENGDTLWTIAKKSVPDQDPRKVVWIIQSENELKQTTIFPGQILRVPYYHYQASI